MKHPYVVYWNNIPAPYMVDRFNAVAYRGNLDLEAWFNARREPDRSWTVNESQWDFNYRYLPVLPIGAGCMRIVLPLLERRMPDLLVSLYAEPVFVVGWAIARARGSRTMFRTLMTFDRWVPRRWWKETLKRYMFSRVDAIETVGKDGSEYARKYGVNDERIFKLPYAFDIDNFISGRSEALAERPRIRKQLGLRGITFIYVGRLWWGKGMDILLEAFKKLQNRCKKETSLLLVGDGPEEDHLRKRCLKEGIHNVVFAGFKQKYELPSYYVAADVFVFPTLGDPYGVVVDEAMACSLPVISTSAAGEIHERIEEGVNGYIIQPENSGTLCDRMERLTLNSELCERMAQASAGKVKKQKPERWAEKFERAVDKILSLNRR